MKQAYILIDEINRKIRALQNTNSEYLKRDYAKSIRSDIKELKMYCKFRGYDYREFEEMLIR